jgi:hexosaminidase
MRRRLAGPNPHQPVDALASLVEPVKGYSRHAERYGIFTPLNRLVDSIPPESQQAREFRNAVDDYLAAPKEQRNSEALRKQLAGWLEALKNVRPILESRPGSRGIH